MRSRRKMPLVATTVLLVSTMGTAPATSSAGQPNLTQPEEPIQWLALGDSFSSGLGRFRTSDDCYRSTDGSYVGLAASYLENDGFPVAEPTHRACAGAHILTNPDSGAAADLDTQMDISGGGNDLITLTIGGNDAGFADILQQCLPTVRSNMLGPYPVEGCWELMYDLDVFEKLQEEDPDVDTVYDSSTRAGYGIRSLLVSQDVRAHAFRIFRRELIESMGLPDIENNLRDALGRLVDEHLDEDGRIVVLGYPRLFEPPDAWGIWNLCLGVYGEFAHEFRHAADELNTVIRRAANAYDEVDFLDIATPFEGHNLCSSDTEWMNGLTVGVNDWVPGLWGSFHPNDDGYDAMARHLVEHIKNLPWGDPEGVGSGGGDTSGGNEGNCANAESASSGSDVPEPDGADGLAARFISALASDDTGEAAELWNGFPYIRDDNPVERAEQLRESSATALVKGSSVMWDLPVPFTDEFGTTTYAVNVTWFPCDDSSTGDSAEAHSGAVTIVEDLSAFDGQPTGELVVQQTHMDGHANAGSAPASTAEVSPGAWVTLSLYSPTATHEAWVNGEPTDQIRQDSGSLETQVQIPDDACPNSLVTVMLATDDGSGPVAAQSASYWVAPTADIPIGSCNSGGAACAGDGGQPGLTSQPDRSDPEASLTSAMHTASGPAQPEDPGTWTPSSAEQRLRERAEGQICDVTVYRPRSAGNQNTIYKVEFPAAEPAIFKAGILQIEDARREQLASRLDEILGFDLVPTAIAWEGPRLGPRSDLWQGGSLHECVEMDDGKDWDSPEYSDEDKDAIAIFDYLFANADRHGGNYQTGTDGRIVAIDHEGIFSRNDPTTIRSTFVYEYSERELTITPEIMSQIGSDNLDDDLISSALEAAGLGDELDNVLRRLDEIRDEGKITGEAWENDGGVIVQGPPGGTTAGNTAAPSGPHEPTCERSQ